MERMEGQSKRRCQHCQDQWAAGHMDATNVLCPVSDKDPQVTL